LCWQVNTLSFLACDAVAVKENDAFSLKDL